MDPPNIHSLGHHRKYLVPYQRPLGSARFLVPLGRRDAVLARAGPFWKNQVFGIYLKNNAGPKQTSGYDGGILTLGGTRTDLYTGDVNWLNVVQTGSKTYWRVAIDAGIVNGGSAAGNAKRASVAGGTALVDTGAFGHQRAPGLRRPHLPGH
jgi:hypothetical protein